MQMTTRTRGSDHRPPQATYHSSRITHPPAQFVIQPHSPPRSTGVSLINSSMKLSDLPSVKLPRRGNLNYKQFLRYVEENYFQSKNLALWMLYKGAHKSRDMTEVCPCAPSVLRPSDYYQGRNVVWQWANEALLGVAPVRDDYHNLRVVR